MRFNDEVQFTVALCRVPADLPEVAAAAPHRSISTDCMTQGDTVCLPAPMRANWVPSIAQIEEGARPSATRAMICDDISNDSSHPSIEAQRRWFGTLAINYVHGM